MSDRQRLHREDPARTGPIRDWSTLYHRPDTQEHRSSSATSKSPDQTTPERVWADAVSHGVELGYRVVEEHIRQGQRVAQQVNDRSYNVGAMGNDIRELVGRLARYYADLGALWGELVNSLVANPDFLNNLLRPLQPQPAPPTANHASANGALTVTIEVLSVRPTQVTLDLRPQSERISLASYGLHAADATKPALTDITFTPSVDHGPVGLRVCIPDEQPPGMYTGVVVDKATNLPRGTLSVRVGG